MEMHRARVQPALGLYVTKTPAIMNCILGPIAPASDPVPFDLLEHASPVT